MADPTNPKERKPNPSEDKRGESPDQPGRRNMLVALAGLPVLGALGIQVLRKNSYDKHRSPGQEIIRELGLGDLMDSVKPVPECRGDLLRIGIVGLGVRGTQLSKALGFVEKSLYSASGPDHLLETQLHHGNMNVAITGICDVFDQRAENGLAIAGHDIHTGGAHAAKTPAKRYRHYHEMLADPDIDAVIITTPDHHHAQMTIDAISAGKHVYCEKSLIHREEEVYTTYEAVKNSGLVFQQGHQNPQNAVFQQAKEVIRRGLLGQITHIETTTNRNSREGAWIRHLDASGKPKPGDERSIDWMQWLGKAPYAPFSIERYYGWARYFDYDTGIFGQLFSHEYDAVNQLLHIGIPETVTASGGQYVYRDFGEIPDMLHTIFEYPNKGLTLTYSANLASSQSRGRTIYGRDAAMNIGGDLSVVPDGQSKRLSGLLNKGVISPNRPMLDIRRGSQPSSAIDAVTTASTQYYASRGLTSTNVSGKEWDMAHLHLREWINAIRNGGETSANIDMAFEEGITIAMADIAYREQCRTRWDAEAQRIVRE